MNFKPVFRVLIRVLAVVGIAVNCLCLLIGVFAFASGGNCFVYAMLLFPVLVVLLVWSLVSGSQVLSKAFKGFAVVYVLSSLIGIVLSAFLYFLGTLVSGVVALVLLGICAVVPIARFKEFRALLEYRLLDATARAEVDASWGNAARAGRGGMKFSMPKSAKKPKKQKGAEQKSGRRGGLDFEPAGAAETAGTVSAQSPAAASTAGTQATAGWTAQQQTASSQQASARAAAQQGTYQQPARRQTASTWQGAASTGQAVPQAGYQQARSQQGSASQQGAAAQRAAAQQTARSASAAGWSGTQQQAASQRAAATQSAAAQSAAARTASVQAGASPQGPSGTVAVNSCPRDAFLTLPGFSIAQASRAVSEREQNGPYRSVDDFVARNNVKPHFAVQMEGLISVETATKASAAAPKRPRGRGLDL